MTLTEVAQRAIAIYMRSTIENGGRLGKDADAQVKALAESKGYTYAQVRHEIER